MKINEILHMKDGEGEFSYAHNCTIQGNVFSNMNKPMIENAIKSLLSNGIVGQSQVLHVADLGCGIGPLPIEFISLVIDTVQRICMNDRVPEIQIYMNDLSANDFNLLFRSLGKLQAPGQGITPDCFVVGAPGSFFGRLFPRNSLHFVHSNYSLHWLSQLPSGLCNELGTSMNKGSITVSETSPPSVVEAYRAQFHKDLSLFLMCRSCELVPNGYMLLALKGSPSAEPQLSLTCKLLYQALSALVSKGLIKEEKLDSFNMPLYFPSKEEIQCVVTEEGSFTIEKTHVISNQIAEEIKDKRTKAESIAKTIRAFSDSLVSHHFGEDVWNILYDELTRAALNHVESKPAVAYSIIALLRKKKMN